MLESKYIQYFTDLIKKIVRQELNNLNTIKTYPAVVTAVSGSLANVKIAGDNINILTDLKNKTGEILAINDQVYVFALNGNLTNSYIGIKK
jgi:hypothetical protein